MLHFGRSKKTTRKEFDFEFATTIFHVRCPSNCAYIPTVTHSRVDWPFPVLEDLILTKFGSTGL